MGHEALLQISLSIGLLTLQFAPPPPTPNLSLFGGTRRDNARFLWKRAPVHLKADGLPLAAVWQVGRMLWMKEYTQVHQALRALEGAGLAPLLVSSLQGMSWDLES